jgi:uncharacterized protein (TIGR02217 family)
VGRYGLVYVVDEEIKWYEQDVEPGEEVEVGFHETQFPPSISYGSRGGPGYRTSIITLQSGAEERIAHLSAPKHRYDVAEGVKSYDDLMGLKRFYIARLGPANGFRFKDWLDFTSNADGRTAHTATDQSMSPGVGDGTNKTFQLIKTYVDSNQSVVRTINKPVAGTVLVAVDDTPTGSGWSVDTTTGVVTFDAAPGDTLSVKAGFEFDVPVRFGEDADQLLDISLDAYDSGSLSVPLVELFNETAADDEFWYGGASTVAVANNVTLSKASGRMVALNVTAASKIAYLPSTADLAMGGPHFFLVNLSGTYTVQIKDLDTDVTACTLATSGNPGDSAELWLGYDSSGDRKWYAIG